ncbi:MAG TPA: COX15/CtaA family protein, partial [Cytophagales bacterium]|nr:COX15/CtaA family protein [Cytophagales bacterium]
MNNIKIFRIFGILTIISLYFLILVGGIVRATGSGMGCPDWPKCFGHYIPPSDISEVSFKQNHSYSKKVFIIHEGKLYYSKSAFVSSNTFNSMNWQQFEEHSYAVFNATHTWIEAFNRYIGVFVGLFVLGLFIYSWLLYKKHGRMDAQYNYLLIMRYSLVALVFVIIQGIIGKYLVSTHLKLKMLTLHMLFSYTVLFAVIYVLYNTSNNYFRLGFNKGVYNIIQISILLTGIQTVLG